VRTPQDQLSPASYFSTETECLLYTNQFYTILPTASGIYSETADYIIPRSLSDEVLGNRSVPSTSGNWNWDALRAINTFIVNADNCKDEAVRNKYLGVARFFRAYFYFNKVRYYGDVPWLDRPLDAEDEQLNKARDSRKYVMQKVLEDIDFAIANLPAGKSVYTVTKWTALALKSRIFLFEGTFRKYHGLGDWEDCLAEAAAAGEQFIQTSGYKIYSEGSTPYLDLFTMIHSDQTEIILSRVYSSALKLTHDVNGRFKGTTMGSPGISKDVVNSYLMKNGSRYTDTEGFDSKEFQDEMKNRDPRLAQTIRTPGYVRLGAAAAPDFAAATTGYQIIKYVVDNASYDAYNTSENDFPIFRTAEVYLNFAEAKAELGTLVQQDLDRSVNKLRDRVGMPHLSLADANTNPDPYLLSPETGYPNVSTENMGVILEIRRERTIELMAEGFRYWDIMRWKSGKRFERPFHGMYFPGTGNYDLDGNGTVDLMIYSGTAPAPISGAVLMSLTDAALSEGPSGRITVHGSTPRHFDETRDYLYPIPTNDRILTGGVISQNPGWNDGLDF
jgi:hypothetical protein